MPGIQAQHRIRPPQRPEDRRGLWKCLRSRWPAGLSAAALFSRLPDLALSAATAATSLARLFRGTRRPTTATQSRLVLFFARRLPAVQIGAATPKLVLYVRARVVDAASGANADLELRAQCFWHKTADTALNA